MKVLSRDFFDRSPLEVAPLLLGKLLVHKYEGKIISGRIVEVEAYLGSQDQAAHSFIGKTKRNQSLFKVAGHAYVHSIHMQNCLDIVTEGENVPSSLLIRALEPIEGIDMMKVLRNKEKLTDLTTGPGKLTQALAIIKNFDGCDLTNPDGEVFVADDGYVVSVEDVVKDKRIGVSKATETELRFSIKNNKFVSKRVQETGNITSSR